jgi:tetratricopeptide (TPR) repeat protein
VVAVADLDDTTGEDDLLGLSGMLASSLEQRPRLQVVARQRLLALAGWPRRLGCDDARRAAAATRATVVLCPRLEREGSGVALEVEPLDRASGRPLAEPVREVAGVRAGAAALVDRVSTRLRRALVSPLPCPGSDPVGAVTTASLEALRHYFLGAECADRPAHGLDCGAEYRRALALDPGFALAAYRLATWSHWFGGELEDRRALLAQAQRGAASLPEKERTLLRGWTARAWGREEEALEVFSRAARDWPEDPEPAYEAADLLRHRDEPAAALPWFEKVVALQPDHGWALGGLVQCLGVLGREEALRAWVARWEAAPGPATLHAASLARGWLGDLAGAQEAARAAVVLGGGPAAQEDLLAARVFAGDLAGAEPDVRRLAGPASPARRMGSYGLAALEAYRGRPRAAVAALDALERALPEVAHDAVYHATRADLLVGLGEAGAAWREVEALRALDPALAAEHAVSLAWLGDLEHARLLARDLPERSPLAQAAAAVIRFREGDRDRGLADLRRVAAATPAFTWRVSPAWLLGALLAEAGRDGEAVAALRRAERLYLPLAMWRAWAEPQGLLLSARASQRLGNRAEARESLGRLLASVGAGEPDAPVVRGAQELLARLDAPPPHRVR